MKVRRLSRKGFSCFAAAALTSTLGVFAVSMPEAVADDTSTSARGIELGIGSWGDYYASRLDYQYVYFGNWTSDRTEENQPVKWRILDSHNSNMDEDDDGMFLMSEYILDVGVFDDDNDEDNNVWNQSAAKQWAVDFAGMNGETGDPGAFEELERDALMLTEKEDGYTGAETENPLYGSEGGTVAWQSEGGQLLTKDYVFFLSVEEVTNEDYGFSSYINGEDEFDKAWSSGIWSVGKYYSADRLACYASEEGKDPEDYDDLRCYQQQVQGDKITWREGSGTSYWLRNSALSSLALLGGEDPGGVNQVDLYGVVGTNSVTTRSGTFTESGYRPAMNLDTTKILLKSAAVTTTNDDDDTVVGKSTTVSTEGMTKISEADDVKSWKLTLEDTSRTFAAKGTAFDSGNSTVSISYSNATTGNNEYVSAIIYDNNDNVVYYQKLASASSASGSLDLTLPKDIADGSYKLAVFSEQANGDKETDYASSLKTVFTFTVSDSTIDGDLGDDDTGDGEEEGGGGEGGDGGDTGDGDEDGDEDGDLSTNLPITGSASALTWMVFAGMVLTVAVLVRRGLVPARAACLAPWITRGGGSNGDEPRSR